jgi:hypothetical protein
MNQIDNNKALAVILAWDALFDSDEDDDVDGAETLAVEVDLIELAIGLENQYLGNLPGRGYMAFGRVPRYNTLI